MEDEKEEQLAPVPYDAVEPYLKKCRNCSRVVFLDAETCPSCDCTEFDTVDIIKGD